MGRHKSTPDWIEFALRSGLQPWAGARWDGPPQNHSPRLHPAMKRILPILLAILGLAAQVNDKATLDNSRARRITYEGRKFEVRVAATDVPNEYRLLVVRATLRPVLSRVTRVMASSGLRCARAKPLRLPRAGTDHRDGLGGAGWFQAVPLPQTAAYSGPAAERHGPADRRGVRRRNRIHVERAARCREGAVGGRRRLRACPARSPGATDFGGRCGRPAVGGKRLRVAGGASAEEFAGSPTCSAALALAPHRRG